MDAFTSHKIQPLFSGLDDSAPPRRDANEDAARYCLQLDRLAVRAVGQKAVCNRLAETWHRRTVGTGGMRATRRPNRLQDPRGREERNSPAPERWSVATGMSQQSVYAQGACTSAGLSLQSVGPTRGSSPPRSRQTQGAVTLVRLADCSTAVSRGQGSGGEGEEGEEGRMVMGGRRVAQGMNTPYNTQTTYRRIVPLKPAGLCSPAPPTHTQ